MSTPKTASPFVYDLASIVEEIGMKPENLEEAAKVVNFLLVNHPKDSGRTSEDYLLHLLTLRPVEEILALFLQKEDSKMVLATRTRYPGLFSLLDKISETDRRKFLGESALRQIYENERAGFLKLLSPGDQAEDPHDQEQVEKLKKLVEFLSQRIL